MSSEQPVGEILVATIVPDIPQAQEINSPVNHGQRLHPSSILFDGLAQIKRFLIPAAIAAVSAASGSLFWLGMSLVFFCGTLLVSVFRYLTLRYRISDGDLVVSQGLIFRRVRTVPVRRIQNVDLTQSLFHRFFNVAEVRIETAGGSEPESTLRVLSMAQVDSLRAAIFAFANSSSKVAAEETVFEQTADEVRVSERESKSQGDALESTLTLAADRARLASGGKLILAIKTKWLIWAGLCSNRGIFIIAIIFGWLFQEPFWEHRAILRKIRGVIPGVEDWSSKLWGLLGLLLLVLIGVRLFGIVWYLLRFYDYRLERYGDDLRISCGLFTKVSATVPRRRIQFISIHRPILFRGLGLSLIRVETAGGVAKESENAVSSVGRHWFVPVVEDGEVRRLIGELRPGLDWDENDQSWVTTSPKTPARLSRMALGISILFVIVGLLWSAPWGGLLGIAIYPILRWWAGKHSRARRFAHTSFGVAYRSGLLTRKLSLTFFERIQTISLEQSPFDRRWQMATLSVDTAGAGPADHKITIPYLDQNFAYGELERLQSEAARHIPVWH